MEEFGQDDDIIDFGQDDEIVSEDTPASGGQLDLTQAELPEPSPNMFAQMDDAEAAALYEQYKSHPGSTADEEGDVSYNGVSVPQTEGGIANTLVDYATMGSPLRLAERAYNYLSGDDSTVMSDVVKGVTGGALVNAPKNAVELAGAAATFSPIIEGFKYLTDSEGPAVYEGTRDAVSTAIDDTLPEFNPEGTAQELGALGGEIGVGVVIGNKVQAAMKLAGVSEAAIQSIASKAPKAINYFSKLATTAMSQAAGTSLTVDSGTDTLAVGPNAMIPIFEGLDGVDPNKAQEIIEGRLNIFLDAMVLAGPTELLADGGKALLGTLYNSFIKPIHGAFSDAKKAEVAFETFEKQLRLAIDPYDPYSQTANEYVDNVINILKDDKQAQIVFPSIKKTMDVGRPKIIDLDVATTVERGFRNGTSDEATNVKDFFNKKRKEVIDTGGVTQTDVAAQRPVRAAERLMQEGREAYGGDVGIDQARRAIQQSGAEEVGVAENLARETQSQLDDTARNYDNILMQDEGLGSRLRESAGSPGSTIGAERNRITGEIIEATRQGGKEVTAQERVLWQNIPEGLPVDQASLDNAVANAYDYLDSSSKKAFREAGVDIDAAMSDEFIEDAPVADFAKLQNTLRKPLNAAIERAKKSGVGYEELLELKNNITDLQPEWLGKRRGKISPQAKEGKKALEKAVSFTAEKAGPTVRSGMPKRIRDIDRDFGLDKVGADQAAFEEFEKAARSDSSPLMKHYAEVLALPEYGEKASLIVDHALASVAEKMTDTLRLDGVIGLKPKEILSALRPYRTSLNSNPKLFKKELSRLDEFEEKIIKNYGDAKKLSEALKEYTKNAEDVKKRVYEEELKEFFTKEGVPNPEGYTSFKKIFLDPQATGKFDEGRLDKMISRMNPAAREGAVAAWFRFLEDQAFTAAPGSGSARQLSTSKVADILREENQVLSIGKKLLGEDAEIVDIMAEILNPALDNTVAKKAAAIRSGESAVSENAAKKSITRMVLAIKGPLTRTGARASVAAATILDILKPNDVNKRIADAMMADRKAFLEMYDAFKARGAKTKENYRNLFNWALKMGIYNESQTFDKWFKEVQRINQDADTEENFPE